MEALKCIEPNPKGIELINSKLNDSLDWSLIGPDAQDFLKRASLVTDD